ncbi:MAG: phytanoyl-CoA dioxygenase family protein [Alphaproteobacteria bacterium]|nr:phytanoyl-CoA dioxygenase family protein [Alphaproteobacteria bacterium]
MSAYSRRRAWDEEGFYIERGLVDEPATVRIVDEIVGRIRSDPPERHPGKAAYFSGEDYLVHCETEPGPTVNLPEDRVSKVFNCHLAGATKEVAMRAELVDRVEELLGPDLDCFQSQFIFKNPGVIGQPWHQDSFYFAFTRQPQVGVWLALGDATLENGCLWVLPGSHREPIHAHIPDRRPQANRGYLEIVDHEFDARVPVTMKAGDVLFFHSFLMHMSTDNVASDRRLAMVYHYGRAGTEILPSVPAAGVAALKSVNRWMAVRRRSTQ